jgi:hypothetical protein
MDLPAADPSLPPNDDALIGDYLARLRRAAWYVPRDRREQVLDQIAGHITAAIESAPAAPEAQPAPATTQAPAAARPAESTQPLSSFRDVAAELGEPKALIRAVDGHIPGTEAGWLEFTAIIGVLLAGMVFSLLWAIGLVLLWTSARWRWPDKLLATLVWPGGLLVAKLLMDHYLIGAPFFGAGSSVRFILDSTLGHHPLRHFLVLAVAIAPPVFVAIRLLRRARRPQLPAITWPTRKP